MRARVLEGGHDVPEAVVRRRFDRSIGNFLVHYRALADSWTLYDNTAAVPRIIAAEERRQRQIGDPRLYNDLMERYGKT